jgi:quaternary ammonium compound-resistance protein SugE
MAWLYLLLAGLFEVGWAIGLKYTEGFSRLLPSLLTIAAMALSLALLGLALRDLPVGTAYAVWTGIVLSAPRHLAFTFSASQRRLCALAALD